MAKKWKKVNWLMVFVLVGATAFALDYVGFVSFDDWLQFGDIVGGQIYLAPGDIAGGGLGFDGAIWCEGKDWLCCREKEVPSERYHIRGWEFLDPSFKSVTCMHNGCKIINFEPDSYELRADYMKYGTRSSNSKVPIGSMSNVVVKKGQEFWFTGGITGIEQRAGWFTFIPIDEELIWTGSAGSSLGKPVIGAIGCSFVLRDLWDLKGEKRLSDAEFLEGHAGADEGAPTISNSLSETVPPGYCYTVINSASRHICGHVDEGCKSDADCGGHTFTYNGQPAECSAGQVDIYGCKPSGQVCVLWKSEEQRECLKYESVGRCGIKSTMDITCCPSSSCGVGGVCTKNFTCDEPSNVGCRYDWDCGVDLKCNSSTKQRQKPVCINNKCDFSPVESIDCCYDIDCSINRQCVNYRCVENVPVKIACPFSCCDSGKWSKHAYFNNRPAPAGSVCCENGNFAESYAACEASGGGGTVKECQLREIGLNCPLDKELCTYRPKEGYNVESKESSLLSGASYKCVKDFPWDLLIIAGTGIVVIVIVLIVARKQGWI